VNRIDLSYSEHAENYNNAYYLIFSGLGCIIHTYIYQERCKTLLLLPTSDISASMGIMDRHISSKIKFLIMYGS
jgi:hypothetical protein